MKFATPFVTMLGAALVMAAPATLEQRQNDDQAAACRAAVHTMYPDYCAPLVSGCSDFSKTSTKIWSSKACVAAAACLDIWVIHDFAWCANAAMPARENITSLDYNLYATIVGDCAWSKNGCPITQQNFVDFFYGTLSSLGATKWPASSDVINNMWKPINTWTNTGATIPYLNFNDWLHYSHWRGN